MAKIYDFERKPLVDNTQPEGVAVNTQPEWVKSQVDGSEQAREASRTVGEQLQEEVNGGADPYQALLKDRYEKQKEDTELQKRNAVWGDIATLAGDTVGGMFGNRRIPQRSPRTSIYDDRLSQLSQWRDSADLNYTLDKAKQDRANRANLNIARVNAEAQKYESDNKRRVEEGKREQEANELYADERDSMRDHEVGMAGARASQTSASASARNAETNAAKASASRYQPNSNLFQFTITNNDGDLEVINIPISSKASIAQLAKQFGFNPIDGLNIDTSTDAMVDYVIRKYNTLTPEKRAEANKRLREVSVGAGPMRTSTMLPGQSTSQTGALLPK